MAFTPPTAVWPVTQQKLFLEQHPGHGAAITPADNIDIEPPLTEIYVGGAGNVAVLHAGDLAAVTFTAPPVGTTIRGQFRRVLSTGTTATNLVGRW